MEPDTFLNKVLQDYVHDPEGKEGGAYTKVNKVYEPTEEALRVLDLIKQKFGRESSVRPANYVDAIEENPIMGTGGGVHWSDTGETIVDPMKGTVHTIAHEAAHELAPSSLSEYTREKMVGSKFGSFPALMNPYDVPRDTGARLRHVHELYAKPDIVEEARAQGIAGYLLDRLGIRYKEGYYGNNPLNYPASFIRKGIGSYANNEVGPPSKAERDEANTILNSTYPLIRREYDRGYKFIQGL
jgi:hypothetical protein